MAIQETTPSRNITIGYRELAAFAVTILVIAGTIMGAMQWAVVTAVTPLREEIRELSRRVDAGFAENRSELRGETGEIRGEMTNLRGEMGEIRGEMANLRGELTAVRNELTDLRKDISDLSNRVTRIETILEQQRPDMTAPDTP